MKPGESVRLLLVKVAVLVVVALGAPHVAYAQWMPTNNPPATQEYCPSNTGGMCFDSRQKAINAMRLAEPEVGQYLTEQIPEPNAETTTLRFAVPNQPPASYSPYLYGINTTNFVQAEPFCPNSNWDDWPRAQNGQNLCTSEEDLVQGYIAAGYPFSGGLACRDHRDPHLVGQPILPYREARDSVLWQYQQGHPNQRALEWTRDCRDHDFNYHTYTIKYDIFRVQRFYCPAGFTPINTTDPAVFPNLCRSSKTTTISVRHTQTCNKLEGNPCNPATGEKFRAETDFTFAGRPFTRYYHSLRQLGMKNARLGSGWTHTYSTFMGLPGWMLKIVSGDGYFQRYRYVSFNRFAVIGSSGAAVGALDKLADGSWRMTSANGQVSAFSSAGILMSISDPGSPERDVTLSYENNSQYQPRLSKVTDSSGRVLQFLYDEKDFLIGVHLPDGQVIAYSYDGDNNLASVDYGNGQVKQYLYGEPGLAQDGDRGLLTGIVSEDGQRYGSFSYDAYGRVIKSVLHGASGPTESTELDYPNASQTVVRTMTGEVRTYTYNASRQILSVTSNGATESSAYNTGGWDWRESQTDRNGNQTKFSYDGAFQQIQRIEAANDTSGAKRTIQTDWHPTLHQPSEMRTFDSTGTLVARTTWTYNTHGQVLTATRIDPATAATRTTTNAYCEQADAAGGICARVGLLLSVDGPRDDVADVTSYAYYASDDPACVADPATCAYRKGDLWKATNAYGHVSETLAYDGAGRPLAVRDANNVITDFRYDERGKLILSKVRGGADAEDRITRIAYWPGGLVKKVTQPDGTYTFYRYDAARRLIGIDDSAGNRIRYTLDNAGNRIKEDTRDSSGALKRTLSRVYDQLGRMQSQSDAYGRATGYTYDGNGNTDAVTDASGRSTGNAYDALNRLALTLLDVGGIGAQTQFRYDARDNLVRVTDPKGLHTDYGYNALGDLQQLTSPDTGVTQYVHDSAGNRTSQTDARGKVQTYSYDALNRLVQVTGPTRKYFYDSANSSVCPTGERSNKGRLSGFNDHSGTTRYCHNRFGDMTRKVQTTNEIVFTTAYAYDAHGRLSAITYPDGARQDVVYDANGQVAELGVAPAGGVRQVILSGVTYAPFGPATGWQYGNGRTLLRSLNRNYQPDVIHDAGNGGLSLGYGFDAVGNLTMLKDGAQAQVLAQYGYDALNRLEQVMDGATGTPIETYTYDATGNRLGVTNAGTTTPYTYLAESHRLDKVGGVARSYDAVGNTTRIGPAQARQFVYDNSGRMTQVKTGGVVTRQYEYNAKGEQTRAWLDNENTYFVYDEAGHLLGEYASDGSPKQQILWFGDLPVGVLAGSGAGQQLHYIEPDHLGTPRVVIDGVRNVPIWTWALTGEAFGATPPNQDPDGDGTVFNFDLRYPGQRYDGATGLNYNYFRDYDASTGRYVESDPIGLNGGVSTYGYTGGNPTAFADPLGLEILGIHSSAFNNDGSPMSGHGWLGIYSDGGTLLETWGAWDPNHQLAKDAKNGCGCEDSNVYRDIEKNNPGRYVARESIYIYMTPNELAVLRNFISQPWAFGGYRSNCAAWVDTAVETVFPYLDMNVTDGFGGIFATTPRALASNLHIWRQQFPANSLSNPMNQANGWKPPK
jgi:RHS repeat-associated protein